MTSPQPPVDYTSKDWAAFVDEMKAAAVARFPEWTSTDPNDFGNVLIESWAYLGDILSFYGDRIANESYLATATSYASILQIASLLDYQPRSTSPATTAVSITLPALATTIIPAGTVVTTDSGTDTSGVQFETDTSVTVTAVVGSAEDAVQTVSVSATQGMTVAGEVVGTSTGLMNQNFTLLRQPIIDGSVIITVVESPNGVPQRWTDTAHLVDAGPTDNFYALSLDAAGATHVALGDGTTGRIPPAGSVIYATYRVGGGTTGNVGSATLTLIPDTSAIVANSNGTVTPEDISVTNVNAAVGGADAESVASIRNNAPLSLSALNRAVTLDDYAGLALRVPTVAKAKAVSKVYTSVVIYVAPDGGGTPNQSLLNLVVASMQNQKPAPTTVTASTPVYQTIDIEAVVEAGSPYTRDTVLQNVTAALADLLSFDNVDFGSRVTLSSVYRAIQSAPGVLYATIGTLAVTGQTTASDVLLPDNVIPTLGTVNVTVTGGIDVASPVGVIGASSGGPSLPSTPGTPTLTLTRCDPDSSHFELAWPASSNADHYEVIVTYLSQYGTYPDNVIKSSIFGPFNDSTAVIDAPLVGNAQASASNQATSVQFTVQAFNGTVGPVTSPSLVSTYLCEQSTSSTPPSVPGQPQVSNFVETGFASNGNPIYQMNVSWTPGANTDSTALVYEVLDSGGNVLGGSGHTDQSSTTVINGFTVTVPQNAASIRMYIAAYNGGVGPVNGPSVTVPISNTTTGNYTGQPTLTEIDWVSYARSNSGISGEVSITGHNIGSVSLVVEYLDAQGNVQPHSYTMQGNGTGPGTVDTSYTVSVTAGAPDSGFSAASTRVTAYASNPNGTSAAATASHAY